LLESISDIYGAFIFGDAALIALYAFAQREDIDQTQYWGDGYLSMKYRLVLISEALAYAKKQNSFTDLLGNSWEPIVLKALATPPKEMGQNKYLDVILRALQSYKKTLFDHVMKAVGDQLFSFFIEERLVQAVENRLSSSIPPNAFFIKEGKEEPIDFRNILYGTTFSLFKNIPSDVREYENKSKKLNLLSIKGIELSTEQEQFNNDIDKARNC
jgi:hypothetical protein